MKSKLFLFLVGALNFYCLNAQSILSETPVDFRTNSSPNGMWVVNNSSENNKIEGSPFVFKNMINKGDVYVGDKVYRINNINYNARFERFESIISNDSTFIIDPQNVKEIVVNNKVFKRYLDPVHNRNTYMQIITQFDSVEVLKKYFTTLQKGSFNPMTQQHISADRILIKHEYFIRDKNTDELKEIKLNKSQILKLLNSKNQTEVKAFVKENDLHFDEEEELTQIIQFYNTL